MSKLSLIRTGARSALASVLAFVMVSTYSTHARLIGSSAFVEETTNGCISHNKQ
jgi:hypothetical protein